MCTKEEVRQVMVETVTPLWMRKALSVIGMISVLFIGWLAYEVHVQGTITANKLNAAELKHAESNSELLAKIDNVRFVYSTVNIEMLGKIDRLSDQIDHIKEIAIGRSKDRYTGTQAEARAKLIDARNKASDQLEDERWKTISSRINRNKNLIEKYHKIP